MHQHDANTVPHAGRYFTQKVHVDVKQSDENVEPWGTPYRWSLGLDLSSPTKTKGLTSHPLQRPTSKKKNHYSTMPANFLNQARRIPRLMVLKVSEESKRTRINILYQSWTHQRSFTSTMNVPQYYSQAWILTVKGLDNPSKVFWSSRP